MCIQRHRVAAEAGYPIPAFPVIHISYVITQMGDCLSGRGSWFIGLDANNQGKIILLDRILIFSRKNVKYLKLLAM